MRIQLNTNQPINSRNIIFTRENNKMPTKTDFAASDTNVKTEEKTTTKPPKMGSAITIASISAVCGFFMLSKGAQKYTKRFLNNIKDYFEKKSTNSSINEENKKKKFYDFSARKINAFIKKSESINNITSFKDVLFMKLMYKTKPTKLIHERITQFFEKASQKTVIKSYEKTQNRFNIMNQKFNELDEYILKNSGDEIIEFNGKQVTKKQLVEEAKDKRELAMLAVNAFIDKSTIKIRYDYINEVTSSLYSTIWDASFKDFWSGNNNFKRKEIWQTFIAADQIKSNKTDFADWASTARNAITYTKSDQLSNVREYIKALDSIIPAKDKTAIDIIEKLEWFVKNPEIFENNKELFFSELNKLKEHKFTTNSDLKFAETLEKYKQSNIKQIDKQINDNKDGMLQEMLSFYYKIAPYELEKSGALTSLKQAVKSFDKSVYLEGEEFFDKVRDLRLGSAPTDVLTIVLSFITLSLGLGHAKDKEQRKSVMLKSGIPIVGGIMAAMYSAVKLVSGGKSIALGLLSGILLNRLGLITNNIRNSHKISI